MTKLVIEIDLPREDALYAYANLLGVNRFDLVNTRNATSFSGPAIPQLLTFFRPANIKVLESK